MFCWMSVQDLETLLCITFGRHLITIRTLQVPPESVATLGVWKRAAMALQRSKLARSAIDDAFLEAAISAAEPAACRITERLLRARASLRACDEKGLTALHWAAYRGKSSLCELLLDNGMAPPRSFRSPHHGLEGTWGQPLPAD